MKDMKPHMKKFTFKTKYGTIKKWYLAVPMVSIIHNYRNGIEIVEKIIYEKYIPYDDRKNVKDVYRDYDVFNL